MKWIVLKKSDGFALWSWSEANQARAQALLNTGLVRAAIELDWSDEAFYAYITKKLRQAPQAMSSTKLPTLSIKKLKVLAVQEALNQCLGVKAEAARMVGITTKSLYNLLESKNR